MIASESPAFDDLVLMPEVSARKALTGQALYVHVLAPVGVYAGRGSLRVLRARPRGEVLELVCGYESYVRLDAGAAKGGPA